MLHALRSRGFAVATLLAFLVAQPVVGCAVLCFLGAHHPGAHAMAGMNPGGSSSLGTDACHTSNVGVVQHDPIQPLSPMVPARAAVIAFAPARTVEPAPMHPMLPRVVSRAVESPPPRIV
jgi:hypothetical protein